MCGIAGVLDDTDDPQRPPDVQRVLDALRHRGPDGEGVIGWRRGSNEFKRGDLRGCSFVGMSTRLSILDLSAASSQPMTDADDRCALLYNGELYNHVDLRRELEGRGISFRTTGDTEVVLQSYLQWGLDAFARFDGMFALAIVDRKTRTLVLARDHLGIKPLYVSRDGSSLVFASELGAIRPMLRSEVAVDADSLFDYLAFGWTDHGARTFLRGVENFPPAHVATVPLDGPLSLDPKPYWEAPAEVEETSFATAVRDVRELLLESVRLQLRSDVPVGVMLSGGLDSSALLGAAREVLGTSSSQITAYGYDASTPELSERAWMEAAASFAGADLRVERYDDQRVFTELKTMVEVQGEPVTSTSVFAQRHLYACMANDGVKVAIGGQGADELFAGYHLLRQRMLIAALRRKDRDAAVRLLTGILPTANVDALLGELDRRQRTGSPDTGKLKIDADWFRDRDVDVDRTLTHQIPESLDEALRDLTFEHSLPRLLRFDDRNAMSVSIENRVPYLSRPLVERAMTLPWRFLLTAFGCTKFVLREAVRGLAPSQTIRRHDKIGFATPESELFRAHASEFTEMISGADPERLPFLDRASVLKELELYERGEIEFDTRMWRWVNVAVWLTQTKARLD
jgi:asparagine synthase (glutamine-hydrolysing)